ncbi:hypothetical protein QCA50_010709 [Cerrena zonata]|uniref:PIG-P domain-containing protein n=1 Tax=Cerrena zonata TaxID=2478898 RepID=A0AAW0G7Z5_9APHY
MPTHVHDLATSSEHMTDCPVPKPQDMAESSPTSPVSPLAQYPPLPPTESRSRAPEFYGFVAWTSTYLLFVLFVLWAVLPDDYILALGITWYPNREWALLLPSYSIVLVLLTYFTYFALALAGTPAFSDRSTITGETGLQRIPVTRISDTDRYITPPDTKALLPDGNGANLNPYLAYAAPNAIPELYDIPIGLVNRVVYHRKKRLPLTARSDPSQPPR